MVPLIAAGIGAAASLAGSGISAYSNYKSQQAQMRAREEAANKLRAQGQITDAEYNALINDIKQYYNNRGSLGNQEDVNEYKRAIAGYNPEDYAAVDPGFGWSGTKEDYLNPYYGKIIGDTANTIQHTAAGAGLGRGTGAALNIAKGVAEKSDDLYRTAMQDYQNERNFEYQKYQDAIRNNQNFLNALREGNEYKIGLQGNLAQDYFATQDSRMSDVLKAQQDKMNAQQTYANAISGLY